MQSSLSSQAGTANTLFNREAWVSIGSRSAGELKFVGAAVGMAIASGLCGLGQGKAVASAAEAVARNPGAQGGIQTLLVLGLAFIESLAIFTLLIIFVK